jgi:phosphoribosylformylglycinamidine synthase
MPRVIVDVMPKPEILDPQGQAIARALPTLGFDNVTSVRQGKRFEIDVEDGGADPLDVARRAAQAMLANPVIEDFTVHVAE